MTTTTTSERPVRVASHPARERWDPVRCDGFYVWALTPAEAAAARSFYRQERTRGSKVTHARIKAVYAAVGPHRAAEGGGQPAAWIDNGGARRRWQGTP